MKKKPIPFNWGHENNFKVHPVVECVAEDTECVREKKTLSSARHLSINQLDSTRHASTMGQSSSQQLGQRSGRSASVGGTPNRMRFRSPFMRRKKHKVPLSAAFAAPHMGSQETLNINTATVEQLMTLPGVNRRIAQCIVDHRAAIGGQFQRIDDLALVSGMGAVKLEQIRPEICVKRKPGGSLQGSSLSSR